MRELGRLLELPQVGENEGGDGGGGHLGDQAPVEVKASHVDNIVGQLLLVDPQKMVPSVERNFFLQ